MIKLDEDLDRYAHVIGTDQPDVIVECGTWRGGSARWFAAFGVDVVTIDVEQVTDPASGPRITWVTGSSTDSAVVERVASMVAGRRTMVVLDSDHSAGHVAAEIEAYSSLVSVGCHLVVEDGIARWLPEGQTAGSPLDAIEGLLTDDSRFELDVAIEALHRVSMYPCGWWKRIKEFG